jgi:hypothetical protein
LADRVGGEPGAGVEELAAVVLARSDVLVAATCFSVGDRAEEPAPPQPAAVHASSAAAAAARLQRRVRGIT